MTTETMKAWREHWQAYAEAFAQPLQGDSLVSRFVTNPNVTGAYAEAWIRATARICFPIGFESQLVLWFDQRMGIEVYGLFRSAI
jgi:hypothetical protein